MGGGGGGGGGFLQKLLSGPMILLTISLKLRMIFENTLRRISSSVLMNISPPNMFLTNFAFPSEFFYQNCRAVFGRSLSFNLLLIFQLRNCNIPALHSDACIPHGLRVVLAVSQLHNQYSFQCSTCTASQHTQNNTKVY